MAAHSQRHTRSRGAFVPIPVSGHYHQGNVQLFNQDSVGRQCVANSIAAISWSCVKDIDTWRPSDMDTILGCGDALYRAIDRKHDLLEIGDIPTTFRMFGRNWMFHAVYEQHSKTTSKDIENCLENSLHQHSL